MSKAAPVNGCCYSCILRRALRMIPMNRLSAGDIPEPEKARKS